MHAIAIGLSSLIAAFGLFAWPGYRAIDQSNSKGLKPRLR